MEENILELKNIKVHYGGVHALDGVDISISAGEIVMLIGPNGAGKSTILKSIFGLAPIDSGEVFWHESKIKPVPYEMVERGVSYVPQGRRVFRRLTVLENLELGGLHIQSKSELKRRIEELMKLLPILKEKEHALSGSLSGGQQQLLTIARGLMTNPSLLLLDEPTLGLSPKIVKEVFAKITEINKIHKTTIVIVEHNLASALHIVNKVYLLTRGCVVKTGSPKDLIESGIIEKAFMGKI